MPLSELRNAINHAQSARVERMLKQAAHSDVISFAGGLPAECLFPTAELNRAFQDIMAEKASEAFQYHWSEGYEMLREQIAARMQFRGMSVTRNNILITHGAQQGLSLISQMEIHPADSVALESPTYVPAIQAFELQHPELHGVDRSSNGIDLESLRTLFTKHDVKLFYVVPTGHNPTGHSLSVEQRSRLLYMTAEFDVPIIEDDAYGEIKFESSETPPLMSFEHADERVLYVGSFSKVLMPGLRLGWIAAREEVIQHLARGKQACDLHTSTLNQLMLSSYLDKHSLQARIDKCIMFYREHRDRMLAAMGQYFPDELKWHKPDAGFSIWVELPASLAADSLLKKSIATGVAFEPGGPFFVKERRPNFMRLSYSNQSLERINDGIRKLGSLIKEEIAL